jgi:probable HAF family extracellular repeat protein
LGINNAGEVVGNYAAADGYVRSFSFSNGLATDLLGALATSSSSSANGINDAGQVVGSYSPGNSGPPHAFIYSNGQIADLGTLGGSYSSSVGIAINNVEQVAGTSTTFYGATHAFLYNNGQMADLGTLPGYSESSASAINKLGQVTGSLYSDPLSGLPSHAFLYSNGQMIDLGTLGGSYSFGAGINDAGQVVGWSTTSNGVVHAFLYSDGTMTDLNSLVDPGSEVLSQANAINDEGQIVAGAYLLAPIATSVPEPGTLGLLGGALTGLGLWAGVRKLALSGHAGL